MKPPANQEAKQPNGQRSAATLASPPPVATQIFGENMAKAIEYHKLLATTGSTRGFIGPREVSKLWDRHILNCAIIGQDMPRTATVADIGSGAGLPGIPLALARPDLEITLIEPLLKRSIFLQEIKEQLGLDNVTVVRGRAEEKAIRTRVGHVDVVTSRAVAPLAKLAAWSLPLTKKGGFMMAMKGSSVAEELERDRTELKKAGGGAAKIKTVGEGLVEEPTWLIIVPKLR